MFLKHQTLLSVHFFLNKKASATNKMTVSGIFLKSSFCLCLSTIVVAAVWYWYYEGNSIKWFALSGMLTAIVISVIISVRHHLTSFIVYKYTNNTQTIRFKQLL